MIGACLGYWMKTSARRYCRTVLWRSGWFLWFFCRLGIRFIIFSFLFGNSFAGFAGVLCLFDRRDWSACCQLKKRGNLLTDHSCFLLICAYVETLTSWHGDAEGLALWSLPPPVGGPDFKDVAIPWCETIYSGCGGAASVCNAFHSKRLRCRSVRQDVL